MRILRQSQYDYIGEDEFGDENEVEDVVLTKLNPKADYFYSAKELIDWSSRNTKWRTFPDGSMRLTIIGFREGDPERRPWYAVVVSVPVVEEKYTGATVRLIFNPDRDRGMRNTVPLMEWTLSQDMDQDGKDRFVKEGGLKKILSDDIGISAEVRLPHEITPLKVMDGKNVDFGKRLTRVHLSDAKPATEVQLYTFFDSRRKKYLTRYKYKNIETGKTLSDKTLAQSETLSDANQKTAEYIRTALESRYVEEGEPEYIPEGATIYNWDFSNNVPKKHEITDVPGGPITIEPPEGFQKVEGEEDGEDDEFDIMEFASTDYWGKMRRISQSPNFEGYFTGNVPDYAVSALGTSMVDASQISGMFDKTNEALNLVNQFDSSLLSGVSFIFNFSKSGAYGVYLSALDEAIKTKALQKELEKLGYKVEPDESGRLLAYPTREEKTTDDIQKDIDTIYDKLKSMGGTAFGINMNSVMQAAHSDAQATQSEDPDIWKWMALLHLGGTIVHEAAHAAGAEQEGPAEQAEQAFINWALPKINEAYQREMEQKGTPELFAPLQITGTMRHANGKGWYRRAQYDHTHPFHPFGSPIGSDLQGRFPMGYRPDSGVADWGMLAQQHQGMPIEKRLGRQFMSPLPPDLDQKNDSLEEQLRKYTREDDRVDPHVITELLLSEDHCDDESYKHLETLLEDRRPKPLLVPIKEASMMKTATLFGWYNNLEISDGSTIPGLSDRVMAWDDRDESFAEEDKWIRSQFRYNPSYDIKGFYYRWIEPRFRPRLWEDVAMDGTNTSPAKRFAAKDDVSEKEELDRDIVKVLNILSVAESKLTNGDIKSTRFVMSEDMLSMIAHILAAKDNLGVSKFTIASDDAGDIHSVWVYSSDVDKNVIDRAEAYLQSDEYDDEAEAILDELLSVSNQRDKAIHEVIQKTKEICETYGVPDIYLVGGYVRDLALGVPTSHIKDLDFSGSWPNQTIKVGGLVAEALGVSETSFYSRTMTLAFNYKDVLIEFRGTFSPADIRQKLRDKGIPTTPLNFDVYNRDFTINMLVYDIKNDKIFDICGCAADDLENGIIRTYFDPEFVCKENPLVILRAIKFKVRYGFEIDANLQKAMVENAPLLFKKYSEERLILERESIKKAGKKEAELMFDEFGLGKLESL